MSMVTGVVLVVDGDVPDAIHEALTSPIPGDSRGQSLGRWEHQGYQRGNLGTHNDLDDWGGGNKCIGLQIYAAGLNYVGPAELIEHLRSLPWGHTGAVLVYDWEGQDVDWDASPYLKPVMINPPIDLPELEKAGPMVGMWAPRPAAD